MDFIICYCEYTQQLLRLNDEDAPVQNALLNLHFFHSKKRQVTCVFRFVFCLCPPQ